MITRPLFLTVRMFFVFFNFYEGLFKKLFRPIYKLKGNCIQCGSCCQKIGIYDSEKYARFKFLKKAIIFYYQRVNDFEFVEYLKDRQMFVFTCKNFDAVKNNCKRHFLRPAICRNYPKFRYFEAPDLFDSCGYYLE